VPEFISFVPTEVTLWGVKSALAHSTVPPDFTSTFSGENLSNFMPTRTDPVGLLAPVAGAVALVAVPAVLVGGVAKTALLVLMLSVTVSICLPSKNPARKITMAQKTRALIETGPETIHISRRARSSALMTLEMGTPFPAWQPGEGAPFVFWGLLERGLQLFGVI